MTLTPCIPITALGGRRYDDHRGVGVGYWACLLCYNPEIIGNDHVSR
jgi:hypothetical protein